VLNPSRVEKSVNGDDGSVSGLCRVGDVAYWCSMGVWHSTCSTINVRQERGKGDEQWSGKRSKDYEWCETNRFLNGLHKRP